MNEETLYEYDELGRLWNVTDAKNQTTEYGYDSQSRIETIAYADGKTVTLSYDADNNLSGYSDGTTSATYTYDDVGRKLSKTVDYGTLTTSFSYTYYGNGLKHTFTPPDNTVYTYVYGLNNELQTIRIPGVGDMAISEYTWNRPKTISYPGGTQRSYTYDSLMRIQSLSVTDSGGNPLLNDQYTYDEVGNILTKTTEHGNYTYGYDAVSRLLTADNPVLDDESYTYDDVGNRLTSADVTGTWNYNINNELEGYADVEYEYDEKGNMIQKRVGTAAVNYIYDAADRLVKVEDDATQTVIAEYYYDPFGRRLWKDVGGTKTYFFYSEEGLIAEYDATGAEIRSYGYKPDSMWTTDPVFLKQGSDYYFYQNDHLGTPQKLTAINGSVVWSAQYSSFGEAIVQVEMMTNNLRFPGQFYDEETGLHYNWFRYYDPGIGRYLRVDPIGFNSGDVHLYRYVKNNPVNRLDPLGTGSLTAVEAGTLFYTWHMGWIDTTHAYPSPSSSLVKARNRVKAAHDGETISFMLEQGGVVARSVGYFCVEVASTIPENKKNPLLERKNQLLYAWKLISEHFEEAQGQGYLGLDVVNTFGGFIKAGNIGQTPSSFSTEDLVSNLVNFYAVVDEQDAELLIKQYAGIFRPEHQRIISKAIWMFALNAQPGYKSWEPQYFDHWEFLSRPYPPELLLSVYEEAYPNAGKIYTQAWKLLRQYFEKYQTPDFPDYFERYHETSQGYIRIMGMNTWDFPGLPKVQYW